MKWREKALYKIMVILSGFKGGKFSKDMKQAKQYLEDRARREMDKDAKDK